MLCVGPTAVICPSQMRLVSCLSFLLCYTPSGEFYNIYLISDETTRKGVLHGPCEARPVTAGANFKGLSPLHSVHPQTALLKCYPRREQSVRYAARDEDLKHHLNSQNENVPQVAHFQQSQIERVIAHLKHKSVELERRLNKVTDQACRLF